MQSELQDLDWQTEEYRTELGSGSIDRKKAVVRAVIEEAVLDGPQLSVCPHARI